MPLLRSNFANWHSFSASGKHDKNNGLYRQFCRISHNASGMGANIQRYLWRNAVSDQYLRLKIFYFRYDSRAEFTCEIKSGSLLLVKLIMQKVSYIPLENILADDPLPRMSKKGWIFDRRGGCQVILMQFILASTAHERITIGYVVS